MSNLEWAIDNLSLSDLKIIEERVKQRTWAIVGRWAIVEEKWIVKKIWERFLSRVPEDYLNKEDVIEMRIYYKLLEFIKQKWSSTDWVINISSPEVVWILNESRALNWDISPSTVEAWLKKYFSVIHHYYFNVWAVGIGGLGCFPKYISHDKFNNNWLDVGQLVSMGM